MDAWPAELGKYAETFPKEAGNWGEARYFYWALGRGSLVVLTPMSVVESNSLPKAKKAGFFQDALEIAKGEKVKYWLRAWVFLDQPPGPRRRDIKEWDLLRFPPGGLPELGKRR